jgi:hypothetical protein
MCRLSAVVKRAEATAGGEPQANPASEGNETLRASSDDTEGDWSEVASVDPSEARNSDTGFRDRPFQPFRHPTHRDLIGSTACVFDSASGGTTRGPDGRDSLGYVS